MDELEGYFDALGEQPDIRFCLTEEQHRAFNEFFIRLQDKYLALHGTNFIATIRRMALIAFRMAMILTALRMMDSGDFSQKQECADEDFERVLSMIRVLVQHSGHVFSHLPVHSNSVKPKDRKEQFLELLPEKFTYLEFVTHAKTLGIAPRTAEGYISQFCQNGLIRRECQGLYTNLMKQEPGMEDGDCVLSS